jgi:hypothetical protein
LGLDVRQINWLKLFEFHHLPLRIGANPFPGINKKTSGEKSPEVYDFGSADVAFSFRMIL